MNHTVVISDVHLTESVPGDDVWMRYRQRRFSPDEELGQLFEHLCAVTRGEALTLILNGDVFDFDAPSARPAREGGGGGSAASPSEAEAATLLARILADNPRFVSGLALLVSAGHTVVVISGNHDAQLAWPRVRERFVDVIEAAVAARGAAVDRAALRQRFLFRAWFHRTPDGIHVEHGHQYDHYCAFRHPMDPFAEGGDLVQPTMGSLSYRHLIGRMGYFNPHVDSTFMLSTGQYVAHWARYYARSRHSLAVTWVTGAMKVMRDLVVHRLPHGEGALARGTEKAATETGAADEALRAHSALFAAPVNEHTHTALRELWLDRAALATVGVAAVASSAALGGPGLAAVAAVASVAAFAAYEWAVPKPPLDDIYEHTAGCQREIARIHGARAVVMGHTHKAFARYEGGVFFGNCGTWSPAFLDPECTVPFTSGRPLIWLRSDGADLTGTLYHFSRGMLVVDRATRGLPAPAGVVLEPIASDG